MLTLFLELALPRVLAVCFELALSLAGAPLR